MSGTKEKRFPELIQRRSDISIKRFIETQIESIGR